MRISILPVVLTAGALLLIGCSDEQKEEAERLEEQMNQMEQESTDTTVAEDTLMDSMPEVDTPAGADAVPEEPQVEGMPERPSGSGYTVQVASCEDEAYARHLVDLYSGRGYDPYVETFDYGGQLYYRVRIGLFDTFGEAKGLRDELMDGYSITAWVDEV